MEYTREKLIEICEKSFVPQSKWLDRDSASSQIKVGKALALLRCGCEFEIKTDANTESYSSCTTDEGTIWIQFWVHDFMYFEMTRDDNRRGNTGDGFSDYHFYLPTEKRLKEAKGGDWY